MHDNEQFLPNSGDSTGGPCSAARRIHFGRDVFLLAGVLIFYRRHQLFDGDPNVENDVPVVRHNRIEEVVFVWSGLMLVSLIILFQVWSA